MSATSTIRKISFSLGSNQVQNANLDGAPKDWDSERFIRKIGIRSRFESGINEFSSTLAASAAENLFIENPGLRGQIDFLILVTQTPDFLLPSTSSIVHHQLGLPEKCASIDINQGCSGYIQGLNISSALIESGQAENVLLITADTYSKLTNAQDMTVRPIFGDAASATHVGKGRDGLRIGKFVHGTDGSGAGSLIAPSGGLRNGSDLNPKADVSLRHMKSNGHDLFMNGREIFEFTLRIAPGVVSESLSANSSSMEQIDFFIFHQANRFVLENLAKKLDIPDSKLRFTSEEIGNTVSSSIPIALKQIWDSGELRGEKRMLLFGFGVGLSWGATEIEGMLELSEGHHD